MSALTFKLKKAPKGSVDVSPLTPDQLHGLAADKIGKLKLKGDGYTASVEDLFEISGEDAANILFKRGSPRLDSLGARMSGGRIEVSGDAGNYLGYAMSGGSIKVTGNAGHWAASSMAGGDLEIEGNAGDLLGGAIPGAPMGMEDGTVIVSGNAGDRVGDKMRRGLLLVKGHAGTFSGSRMLAGTVIILGNVGDSVGFGMKRGTIILANAPERMTGTFNSCGYLKMEVLRVLFRQLSAADRRFSMFKETGPEAQRYAGDMSFGGKGEILILDNPRLGK